MVFSPKYIITYLLKLLKPGTKRSIPTPSHSTIKTTHIFYPQNISEYVGKVSLSKTILQFYNHFMFSPCLF